MKQYEFYLYTNNATFAQKFIVRENKWRSDRGYVLARLEKKRDVEEYRIVLPVCGKTDFGAKIASRLMNVLFKADEKLWLKRWSGAV